MKDGINLTPEEWQDWAKYHAHLFPTAEEGWLEQMTRRMMKTLGFTGKTTPMSPLGYQRRLEILLDSLNMLPDDAIRGGGAG